MELERITDRLANLANVPRERLVAMGPFVVRALVVVAVGYVAASSVSAYLMSNLLGSALSAFGKKPSHPVQAASMTLGGSENYRDLIKTIKDRNIFNSAGEFPDEKSPEAGDERKAANTFDINGPCKKPQASVELLGTIFLGGTSSIATIQEQGYSESDIYREGDTIVGSDTAQIVKIERNRVIINNAGVKECLELAGVKERKDENAFPDVTASGAPPAEGAPPPPPPPGAGAGSDVVLEEKYVQDELGPGFGTIIQNARLVPNTTENVMNGFKIFAINGNSLLAKVGLKNGDIITQVNETSLKQPEQGFALYQAFQDEREVRIHILRQGTTPMMITTRIK